MSTRECAQTCRSSPLAAADRAANTAIADHAVAVSAGRILAMGPAAQLRARFEIRERVVRERHALRRAW